MYEWTDVLLLLLLRWPDQRRVVQGGGQRAGRIFLLCQRDMYIQYTTLLLSVPVHAHPAVARCMDGKDAVRARYVDRRNSTTPPSASGQLLYTVGLFACACKNADPRYLPVLPPLPPYAII